MDWDLAVTRNREPLLRIVATLFVMIGLKEGGMVERLPVFVYRMVLKVLRPAEAAVRRLIIVAARDIVIKPSKARPAPKGLKIKGKGGGRKSFRLFDPRQRFTDYYSRRYRPIVRAEPRIRFIDVNPPVSVFNAFRPLPPVAPPPAPEPGTVNAVPLCRRLLAIKHALEDLAYQARRYARWRARPVEERRPKLASPLRPGLPPGFREKPAHEVEEILSECHRLARNLPQPDTS